MKISKYAPASWSRRTWIAAFVTPGILAFTLAGCAPAETAPTLEDAGKECVAYVVFEKDSTLAKANRTCEILFEDMGEEAFIEMWAD